jgi:hypothetical protein
MVESSVVNAIVEPAVRGHDSPPERCGQNQIQAVVDRTPVANAVSEGVLQQPFGRVDCHRNILKELEGGQARSL